MSGPQEQGASLTRHRIRRPLLWLVGLVACIVTVAGVWAVRRGSDQHRDLLRNADATELASRCYGRIQVLAYLVRLHVIEHGSPPHKPKVPEVMDPFAIGLTTDCGLVVCPSWTRSHPDPRGEDSGYRMFNYPPDTWARLVRHLRRNKGRFPKLAQYGVPVMWCAEPFRGGGRNTVPLVYPFDDRNVAGYFESGFAARWLGGDEFRATVQEVKAALREVRQEQRQ